MFQRRRKQRAVLANRADGLGYRLNAMLNGMRMAQLLGVDFRFAWPLRGQVPSDINHAVVPAEQFFSAAFLADHLIDDDATGFVRPEGRSMDLKTLRDQIVRAERGLVAPVGTLERLIDHRAVPEVSRGFSAEFTRIGFHRQIEEAIAAAHEVALGPDAVGIHLRAGDNVFGRFRMVNRFWNKAIPAPIARELIRRARADGRDVVIFGQDAALIAELCASTGAIDATALRPTVMTSRSAEGVFDLVVMSRCQRIIAGDSAFAVQAAAIGDKKVEFHTDLMTPDESLEIIRSDLAVNGERYHPIQRAFAWWVAYYRTRDTISNESATELIEAAIEADPDNPRSRLRLAALSYRQGDSGRGDDLLVDALTADVAAGRDDLQSVLLFSQRAGGKYFDSRELFDDFERAVDTASGPASLYWAAIRAQRGETEGAMADVAAFRAYAAADPRLSSLTDLDALVEATMLRRMGAPKT